MSVSNYRSDRDALAERVRREQQSALDERALYQLFAKHRELANVEANRQILLNYFNSDPMDLVSLEEAILNPALSKQLAYTTPQEDRAASLATIERITGSIPVTAQYQSNEELAAKAEELTRRRELSKKPVQELRQIIREGKPAPEQVELPAEMTREHLLALSKPGEFKRVCERYGVSAVTRRLNQR
jgi:hypothetical protein